MEFLGECDVGGVVDGDVFGGGYVDCFFCYGSGWGYG